MPRLKPLLGAGALALASLAITPASPAQATGPICPTDSLCLAIGDEVKAVVPDGQSLDSAVFADVFFNHSDSDALMCASDGCRTIPANRLLISRDFPVLVTSVEWP